VAGRTQRPATSGELAGRRDPTDIAHYLTTLADERVLF
jgi:hypothetical protein